MACRPDAGSSSAKTSNLIINVEDLVNCNSVEKQRLEFKASWNDGPTKYQIIKTICAFANDFYNDNGGYIVIGVRENKDCDNEAQIELPPVGIERRKAETVQKEILGACKSLICPSYTPIVSPEELSGKLVLVIWAQASNDRPHKARKEKKGEEFYFIRNGPETVQAKPREIKILLENAAKIPFDDRRVYHESGKRVSINAINNKLVMKFLNDVSSKLERGKDRKVLVKMNLVVSIGDRNKNGELKPIYVPKNVALLMFNHCPHVYFPCAKIEVTHYTRDNVVVKENEKEFVGPLHQQINDCLDYIYSVTKKEISVSLVTYPVQALREAIVNAVYHRGYEPEHNATTKVRIRPHCLEIISYPGPHPSLTLEEFRSGSIIPPVKAKNRRIGEFLRDLNLAEARGTGVQTIFRTMKKNEYPLPTFKFDSTYFCVTLPAHPKFKAAMLLNDVKELEKSGDRVEASKILSDAFEEDPKIINRNLLQKLILLLDSNFDNPRVKKYKDYIDSTTEKRCELLKDLESWLSNRKRARNDILYGRDLIKNLVKAEADSDDLSLVTDFITDLLDERNEFRKLILKSNQDAHMLLEAYGPSFMLKDGRLAYYFACAKFNIYLCEAGKLSKREIRGRKMDFIVRFLVDARDLLQNAVTMSSECHENEESDLQAIQQRQLSYINFALFKFGKARKSDYEDCKKRAKELNPKIIINSFWVPSSRDSVMC